MNLFRLRTDTHKTVGHAVPHDTAVPHAVVRLDAVIGAGVDIVVVYIDTDLLIGITPLEGGNTIAKTRHPIVADHIPGTGDLYPFSHVLAVNRHGFAGPFGHTDDHIVGDIAVCRVRWNVGPGTQPGGYGRRPLTFQIS